MHKHDVSRQTDSRIEKVRRAYSRRGMDFPEQHIYWLRSHVDSYAYGKFLTEIATNALHTYTKEHNMTPLQAATNKRDVLLAERNNNNSDAAEMGQAVAILAERNAAITVEVLGLDTTIAVEKDKELKAKHRAMADELRAAGYTVFTYDRVASLSYLFTLPYGDLSGIALSGGGKAPGMNTPGTGAGSAQPATKLGGVHGVGEGWYQPIVYDSQGVKLTHEFAINTRDHHEARSGWWLKHVPSGHITKGFPNEQEVHRWIRARSKYGNTPAGWIRTWYTGHYHDVK